MSVLHNKTGQNIQEWVEWYYEHRDDGRSIENEIAFMKRAMDGLLDILAQVASDMHHKSIGTPAQHSLYLPRGMKLRL